MNIKNNGCRGVFSSTIAGGKFIDGFRQGVIVSGLNHIAHGIYFTKTLLERFTKGKLDPFAKPKFTQEGIVEMHENVEGLKKAFEMGGKPKIAFNEPTYYASTVSGLVKLTPSKLDTNYKLAAILFHEYRHAFQYFAPYFNKKHYNSRYDYWLEKYGPGFFFEGEMHGKLWDSMEYDAYSYQLNIGDNEPYVIDRVNKYTKIFKK